MHRIPQQCIRAPGFRRAALSRLLAVLVLTGAITSFAFAGVASAKEYLVGLLCDRTGPTNPVGLYLCDGFHDYVKLFNSRNGLGAGNSIRVMEIDHAYNVPRGVEGYERMKAAGIISLFLYGTPHTAALAPKVNEDHLASTTPGFGSAAAADGRKFPYLFPAAASYWSQAGGAMQFVMENWKGPGKPKVAYIFGDNPAGREPLAVMEDIAALEGVELRTYAVPPPYIEMRPQVIDITRRFKADWIVSHLFGRAPGISLKEFHRMGTPLTRVVGLVWSAAESDIRVAGWDTAEGYYNVQFAFVGSTGHPLLDDVRALYKSEGKPPPEAMSTSVYYNRGLAAAALHAEAIRTAIAAKGINITSVDVKNAMERIKDFSLDDFMAPINMAPDNHEGGGFVRIFQVHDGGYRPITGWYQGYRDVVLKRLATEG